MTTEPSSCLDREGLIFQTGPRLGKRFARAGRANHFNSRAEQTQSRDRLEPEPDVFCRLRRSRARGEAWHHDIVARRSHVVIGRLRAHSDLSRSPASVDLIAPFPSPVTPASDSPCSWSPSFSLRRRRPGFSLSTRPPRLSSRDCPGSSLPP